MKVVLVGAGGMVGQGVLQECINASDVSEIILLSRGYIETDASKVRQLVVSDFSDIRTRTELEKLDSIDGCFYCLGVSSAGLSEQEYAAISYDLTLKIAQALSNKNPDLVFNYVSGAGTDSSEKGKTMWARVKGRTENELQKLRFKSVYLFRPGLIQPLNGIKSKTNSYRTMYQILKPFFPLLKLLMANSLLTTQDMGIAMLNSVRHGYKQPILEIRDIRSLAGH